MKNKNGNIAMVAIIIVIVAITAGVLGWMFAKKTNNSQLTTDNNQAQQTQPVGEVQAIDETVDWQTYTNKELGLEFRYPGELGNPSIQLRDAAGAPQSTGKAIDVYFERNQRIAFAFTAYTPDFNFFDKAPTISCVTPGIFDNKGGYCDKKKFTFGDGIIKNELEEIECSVGFSTNVVFENQSNSEYKILSFSYPPKDINSEITSLYNCEDNKEKQAYEEALLQSKNIINGTNLSQNDKDGLDTFNRVLSTFKFIN